jgi:hypothetical protein
MHGDGDKLIDPAASRELHTIIASSTLTIYPGMGHSLPRSLWPDIVAEIRHVSAHNRDHHQPGHVATARRDPVGRSCGTVDQTVFSARHAGLRSGGMGTVSDDIRRCESTQA